MKKLLGIALLALPLCASLAQANNTLCVSLPSGAYHADFGVNFHFKLLPLEANASQLGPWYLYWPQEAHFVVPAPTGYPYWPSPMTLPNISLGGPPPQPAPPGPAVVPAIPQPPHPTLSPASYSVPTYWYDR